MLAASFMRHSARAMGQGSRRVHDHSLLQGRGLPGGGRLAPRHLAFSTASPRQQPPQQQQSDKGAWGAPDALSTEDRLAILELCHRFDAAINTGQQHTLGQFFAAEAEVHHPKGSVKGVEELVTYFKAMEPLARGNRHLTLNVIIESARPDGGAARATAYRLLHRAAAPPALLASGTIEDEVVKSGDGRWRFARRRFIMDPPSAAAP